MKKTSAISKLRWNEAVKATLAEVRKWDGIDMSDKDAREWMIAEVFKKVAYKVNLQSKTYKSVKL